MRARPFLRYVGGMVERRTHLAAAAKSTNPAPKREALERILGDVDIELS